MDKMSALAAFEAAGLSQRVREIEILARPSVRLYTTAVQESSLPIGVSKLGGSPDLPAGTLWPEWKGLPQSFLAQIRLDELPSSERLQVLPPHGMLWFFYDGRQQTFGDNPADAGSWRVLFSEKVATLQRTPAPAKLPAQSRFQACAVRFAYEWTFPQQLELELTSFDWTDEEVERYETTLSHWPDQAAIHHRMLGYADTLQDDMRLQCQLMTHGVTSPDDPRIDELSKGASDWQLLLQVDSDEQAGMRWATAGMVYYWIKLADLQARRFEKIWMVLQSE